MENTLILAIIVGIVSFIFLVLFIVGLVRPQSVHCDSRIGVFWCYGTFLLASMIVETLLFNAFEVRVFSYQTSPAIYKPIQHITTTQTNKKRIIHKEEIAMIGQTVRADYFAYAVNKCSFRKSFGHDLVSTADGIYLIVGISITNLSEEPRSFPFNDFYVTDQHGARYTFQDYTTSIFRLETSSIMDWDFDKLNGLRIFQPNVPTKDYMLFEVPQRGTYYLHMYGSSNVIALE